MYKRQTSYYVGMHDERGVRRSLATQLLLSAALTVVLTALALVCLLYTSSHGGG